jgi:hypothetical protein
VEGESKRRLGLLTTRARSSVIIPI